MNRPRASLLLREQSHAGRGGGAGPPGGTGDPIRLVANARVTALLLGGAVALLVAAGSTVALIELLTGSDHLMGFRDLLDLNGESNLPTWFSSALLAVAAALLAFIGRIASGPQRRRWWMLAAVFVLLSIDEASGLHELMNAPLRALLHAGAALYFPWIIVGLGFAAAIALAEWRLLASVPRRTRAGMLGAGAIYVTGAVGLEALAAPLYAAAAQRSFTHLALVVIEESLEMIGLVLFVGTLVDYLARTAAPVRVRIGGSGRAVRTGEAMMTIEPAACRRVLLAIVLGLAALSAGTQLVHYLDLRAMPTVVRMVNLSREGNLPTWYQATTLLAGAAIAGAIAAGEHQRGSRHAGHWTMVALVLVYMSADESGGIHELSVRPLRQAFHTSGLLYYPWIVLGAAAVLIAAVASRRLILSLPARTRRTLVWAATVFVTGALGVEAVGGMVAEARGRENLVYTALTTVEETLEMIGVVMALGALLEYLGQRADLRVVSPSSGAAEAGGK